VVQPVWARQPASYSAGRGEGRGGWPGAETRSAAEPVVIHHGRAEEGQQPRAVLALHAGRWEWRRLDSRDQLGTDEATLPARRTSIALLGLGQPEPPVIPTVPVNPGTRIQPIVDHVVPGLS
jgi:hypothetical protein